MQRVGRACAVCRESIHFEWCALGCASCAAAFHAACRAADDAGAAYRSRGATACSRCGGALERAHRAPVPEPAIVRATLAERVVSAAFVSAAFLGMLVSALLVLGGGGLAFLGAGALGATRPAEAVIAFAAALVSLVAGLAGLAVSALGIRTPWSAVARPPIETMCGAREPSLDPGLG